MSSSDDHIGNHAQTQLRKAIAENGNDWDRDSRKREQLILEVHALDQKLAGHEQRHREYSTALAILETVLPGIHLNTTNPIAPGTAEEFETTIAPVRAATPYNVTVTEQVHLEGNTP